MKAATYAYLLDCLLIRGARTQLNTLEPWQNAWQNLKGASAELNSLTILPGEIEQNCAFQDFGLLIEYRTQAFLNRKHEKF